MARSRKGRALPSTSSGSIRAAVNQPEWNNDSLDAHVVRRPGKKSSRPYFLVNLLTWSFFLWVLNKLGQAMPQENTFFTRFFELEVRSGWDLVLVDKVTTWLLVLSAFSLINMAFGVVRNGGRYRANELAALVLAGIACAIAVWLLRM
ncbi:MAG: hypothetical protein HQL84_17960 [Magnetococcales bacterium]|nr:hypothetical protein [Magnetococcales bacterium]MBF0151905.1 hypothetical protein [Magnetococcales bacterium]MBF0632555.1 hypothetical protein [Magnetococcales bacterium]